MMINTYHATPYIPGTGCYFKTYEEYIIKADKYRDENGEKVEEYEIQYIDGVKSELFKAFGLTQANIKIWFDKFQDLDGEDLIKTIYLLNDPDFHSEHALDFLDEVKLFEGTAKDYVYSYIDNTRMLDQLPENLRYYFDYEAFTRDMLISGDISEITINNKNYVSWGI